jgi:hypothetical protein
MRRTRLRVVIFQEGDWLCAQCLDYDIATQAKSLPSLRHDLERLVIGHVTISLKNGLKPFTNLRPAPEKYWELFRRSKIALPPQASGLRVAAKGVKLPSPEIRVAPLAA